MGLHDPYGLHMAVACWGSGELVRWRKAVMPRLSSTLSVICTPAPCHVRVRSTGVYGITAWYYASICACCPQVLPRAPTGRVSMAGWWWRSLEGAKGNGFVTERSFMLL